ncbi:MAG: CopG family transcriptional regulator [Actinomycetota bacterium]
MKRTQIYLDEAQDERLSRRAAALDSTKSALIRRAIEDLLGKPEDEEERLARFREDVMAAAGVAPYLPTGEEYVAALRAVDLRRQEELERRRRA